MRTTLVAVLVLATAGTAAADAHNEVMIGSFTRAMRASSANAVTESSLGGGVVGYAREVDLELMPKLQTWATASFAWGGADGRMFSTLTTELTTQTFAFGGRARYTLLRPIAVGARVDLGPSRAGLTITEGDRTLHDSSWGVAATTAVAVELLPFSFPAFKLGFRAELGYTLTSKLDLAPAEANDSSMIQLEMSQASLGHLDVGGKFFSLTVMSQF